VREKQLLIPLNQRNEQVSTNQWANWFPFISLIIQRKKNRPPCTPGVLSRPLTASDPWPLPRGVVRVKRTSLFFAHRQAGPTDHPLLGPTTTTRRRRRPPSPTGSYPPRCSRSQVAKRKARGGALLRAWPGSARRRCSAAAQGMSDSVNPPPWRRRRGDEGWRWPAGPGGPCHQCHEKVSRWFWMQSLGLD
jgi:hypothetical protein